MKAVLLGLVCILAGSMAYAQGAQVPFVGLTSGQDTTIEVTADSLGIDQNTGKAVFTGNVVVGIDEMRLSADKVEVVHSVSLVSKSVILG